MRILKDLNEENKYVLAIQNNTKAEIKIIGVFNTLADLNTHYESVKITLKALNKKVVCVDNI